jgi:hypothetical protein
VREFLGLTPDDRGFVHVSCERHPVRVVAKGRDDNLNEFVIVVTGGPNEQPSFLGLSLDDARRLLIHLVRVLNEPPARMP